MKIVLLAAYFVGLAAAAPQKGSTMEPIPILKMSNNVQEDGSFQYEFETGNGISAKAQGALKDPETLSVQGSWSWTADDGQTYTITYVADENGFQPQGAHLPTPPPVPEAIVRSLEWNAAHPEPEATRASGGGFSSVPLHAAFPSRPLPSGILSSLVG